MLLLLVSEYELENESLDESLDELENESLEELEYELLLVESVDASVHDAEEPDAQLCLSSSLPTLSVQDAEASLHSSESSCCTC